MLAQPHHTGKRPVYEIDLLTLSLQHLASEHEPTLLRPRLCQRQLPGNPFHGTSNQSFSCWLPKLQPKVLQWTNPLCVLLFETAPQSVCQALSCLSSFAHFINKNRGFMSRSFWSETLLVFVLFSLWKATPNCHLILKHQVSFTYCVHILHTTYMWTHFYRNSTLNATVFS